MRSPEKVLRFFFVSTCDVNAVSHTQLAGLKATPAAMAGLAKIQETTHLELTYRRKKGCSQGNSKRY
jgi:hypothetical protein